MITSLSKKNNHKIYFDMKHIDEFDVEPPQDYYQCFACGAPMCNGYGCH